MTRDGKGKGSDKDIDNGKGAADKSNDSFDTSTDDRFFDYYLEQSQSVEAIARFERLADLSLKMMARDGRSGPFDIADIGGGAGTLGRIFARGGHRVTCIDVSADLLALGQQRAEEESLNMEFVNCSATSVPLDEQSIDICVVPELLEHVDDWRAVLNEAGRLLRPGGLLYLSTTNTLCPRQDEFEVPLYSWYPRFLKNYCVRLARTTQPWLANYGKYPAVNWFTYQKLCAALSDRGFDRFMDRLDMISLRTEGTSKAKIADFFSNSSAGRFGIQLVTPNSVLFAFKSGRD